MPQIPNRANDEGKREVWPLKLHQPRRCKLPESNTKPLWNSEQAYLEQRFQEHCGICSLWRKVNDEGKNHSANERVGWNQTIRLGKIETNAVIANGITEEPLSRLIQIIYREKETWVRN